MYRSNSGCLQLCCAIGCVLQLSMEMKAEWLHLPTHTRDQGSSNCYYKVPSKMREGSVP